jgi:hypothetical protein
MYSGQLWAVIPSCDKYAIKTVEDMSSSLHSNPPEITPVEEFENPANAELAGNSHDPPSI